jgi:hypothetical protein
VRSYSSKSLFVYEQDFPNGLAPGTSAQATFNTHGDSDFFWEKFAAFGIVAGAATTRTLDQLPAVSMSVTNQTTGRVYSNVPIALPNFAWYGDFMPHMVAWPKKSSILVTLNNFDSPTVVTANSAQTFTKPWAGSGNSGGNWFIGYASGTLAGGPVGSTTPSPATINGETLLAAGLIFGTSYFYVLLSGGAQNVFSSVTTSGVGPLPNTYTTASALYLTNGNSGTLAGQDFTATGGNLWVWQDVNDDFSSTESTTLSFPANNTTYSLLAVSFIGTKAFP